ncbi:putative uncharacterized protein DDB_G0287457 isoform X3 [Hydra vulgaris]|uniref:Microtubule-associated protein 9 n=1 Tax=Hydra vulgaris TaxID=6087 RepID=A0ABM4BKX5_HYDVU
MKSDYIMDHINGTNDRNLKIPADHNESKKLSALNSFNNHVNIESDKSLLKDSFYLPKEISHFSNETSQLDNKFGMSNSTYSEKKDFKIDFVDDKKSSSSSSSILDKFYNTYGSYLNNNSNNKSDQIPQNNIKLKSPDDGHKNTGESFKNINNDFLKSSIKNTSFNESSQSNIHDMKFKSNEDKYHSLNENKHKKSNENLSVLEKHDSIIKDHFLNSDRFKYGGIKTHDLDTNKHKKSNEHLNVLENNRLLNKNDIPVVEKHDSTVKKQLSQDLINEQFQHKNSKSHGFDENKHKKSNEHLNVLENNRFLNKSDIPNVEKHDSKIKKQLSQDSINEQFKHKSNKGHGFDENKHKKSNEHLDVLEKDRIINKNEDVENHSLVKKHSSQISTDNQFKHNKNHDSREKGKSNLNHSFNDNLKTRSYEKLDQNYEEHKLNDDSTFNNEDPQVDALFESSQISARGLKARKDFTKSTPLKNDNRRVEKKSNSSDKIIEDSFGNKSNEQYKKETGLSRQDSKLTHKSILKDDDSFSKKTSTSTKKKTEKGFNEENEQNKRHKVNDSMSSSKTLPLKATLQLKDATKNPLAKSSEDNAVKKQRPKSATLTKKSTSFTNISNFKPPTPTSSDQINSVLLREQIYYDWLQRKQSFTKELQQEKLKKNQEEEEEKRNKEEEKKLLAKKSFEAWTETKMEKLKKNSIKKKESEEKKKELEEEKAQKIKDSKKTFDNWKENKEDQIKKEKLKKQKEETKKKKEGLNQSLEKAADAKKVFENWKQQKDELLKKKIIEQKEEIRNKSKAELDKMEKKQQSQQAFENWKEKKSSRPSSPALTQRAWCPVGRNPKDSIPASVQPVILRNVPPSIRMRTLSVS